MQNDALKLLVTLAYSLLVAFSALEYYYSLPLLLVLYIERKSFEKIIKKTAALNVFILFLVLFVAFENQLMAMELFIRINLILLFTTSLFLSSKGYDIVRGLSMLRVSSVFITVFYFTLNMIAFLTQEIKAIKSTLNARSFRANTSLFAYQTFGNVFALLFIKALQKSQELQYSMESRGFNGKIYLITSNTITRYDLLIVSTVVFIFCIKGFFL